MLLLSLFLACGDKGVDTATLADIADLAADVANGATKYTANCSGCHGSNAEGGSGPALAGESLDDFVDAIQNGVGIMPAFPDLTDQDIVDIHGYVESL